LSDTTGKTTLMVDLVRPLEDLLAVVTELGPPVDVRGSLVVATALRGEEAGLDATAYAPPARTTRPTATMAI
jgi:hypothetical protein